EYVVEMKNIVKKFSGIAVLDDVQFNLKPGEVHALMGENGAGKSTLMKILTGIYSKDEGEVFLEGQKVEFTSPMQSIRSGISMIHQELNPILDLSVAENIFVGREKRKNKLGALSVVDKKSMITEARELMQQLDIHVDPRTIMRSLTVAQFQLIEIVKAISMNAKVVIMDEPTSAIAENEVEILFEQIRRLRDNGVGIIYISHKMDEIFRIADRITVLRDGKYIGCETSETLDKDKLISMMVGRDISDIYPKEKVPIGNVVMEVKDLTQEGKFEDISFELHSGEILGVAGLVGAGRTELVECIFGITKADSGTVFINGQNVHIKHPKDAIKHKIALITEDRKFTGLNLEGSVRDNVSIVSISDFAQNGIVNRKKELAVVDDYIDKMRIKTFSKDTLVKSLSGGNQQKVVVAKWLVTEPDIIIMDEPTRGIDVGAKRDIYLLMGEMVKQGKAVIMISSEMPEVMGMSDRIMVLSGGQLAGFVGREEFDQETILRLAAKFGGAA
ncbi:MAG: sugar ABC transporter ATP-binding protein, partial [Christensenellaceae bacterium]